MIPRDVAPSVAIESVLEHEGVECKRCRVSKKSSDFSATNLKRNQWCRECQGAYSKEWYRQNTARHKQLTKQWANENRERCKEWSRRSYWKDPLKARERNYEWRAKNPDRWKGIITSSTHRRRARLRDVPCDKSITLEEVYNSGDQKCRFCGSAVSRHEASVDHVVPISLGGGHVWDNVQLLHKRCNSRKGQRMPITPILKVKVAIESVLDAEGGYAEFAEGPTNYGIVQSTYDHYCAVNKIQTKHVKGLESDEVDCFYFWYLTVNRWQDIRSVKPLVPLIMLAHMLVIHGHRAGARVFQDGVSRATGRAIAIDGMIGAETLAAMKLVAPMDLVQHLEAAWCAKFERICAANPEKRQYRNGWLKRATGWSGGWKP